MSGGINREDPDNPVDNKDHVLMSFFRNKLSCVINNSWCKLIIILIFATYLAGACYGITQIKEGLERRKLSREDSYSVEFFDREDDYYREFPYRMQVIITGDLNYSDPMVQDQIEELTRNLENTSYVTSSLYTESWLRSFVSFVDRNNDYLNLTLDTEQEFIEAVKEHWLFPGNPFSLDVKFNENETRIIASRFLIQAVNITDTNHEKVMVRDLRQICKDSPLNATIFHPYFVFFDQFELVRPTSLQSMIIGAIIMMIISFIFIPNILCSLWVAFSVISIELGVAGYMALWDVNLDSISMINLIMCIGFSVDFTAHICYTYMSSKKKSPKARVREAFHSLGLPILQGSSSTILGIVALLLAQSYIFLVFFKMVFLVIFFGAMHGLFLLPVLLSLFGPGSWQTWTGRDTGSEEEIDDLDSKLKMTKMDKNFINSFYMPYGSTALNGVTGFASKGFLGAPYKAYGDEKDLGIGTSGEDSSESSSSRSQRRQALEDETTQRRYEEGWRKSSYNDLFAHKPATTAQFQAQSALYNQKVSAHEWRHRLEEEHQERKLSLQRERFAYDNYGADLQRRQGPCIDDDIIMAQQRVTPSSSLDERSRRKYRTPLSHNAGSGEDMPTFQHQHIPAASTKRYQRRRSSEDSTRHYHTRWPTSNIEERFMKRQHSPSRSHIDDGDYPNSFNYRAPQPPKRSSSHHNLYAHKQPPPPTYQFGGPYYQH